MSAEIIDLKPHLRKKIEEQLEKEADILFEGEGIMEGTEFLGHLKDAGVHFFVVLDDIDEEEKEDG